MTDTKTIHDMLIQIEGGDNDMEVINQDATVFCTWKMRAGSKT